MSGRGLRGGIVAGAESRVAERLVALIDKFRARFGFPLQGRRMGKTIRMPHLKLFVPRFLDLRLRGGGQEIEEHIVIGRLVVLHQVFLRHAGKCNGVSKGDPEEERTREFGGSPLGMAASYMLETIRS